jgi:FixJ family two-component response regulator
VTTRRWNILLVDDDEDAFVLSRALLSEAAPARMQLEWAGSYREALEAMRRNQHDAYLVDYYLGAKTGLDLLREARAAGLDAPVIMLTGQGDREIDYEAMEAGAADYLSKGRIDGALLERSIRYAVEHFRVLRELRAAYEREREETKRALAQYRAALVEETSPVTAQMAGIEPLKERAPEIVTRSVSEYAKLLDLYVDSLGFKGPAPHEHVERFAEQLGEQNAGPRDVIDIHLRAVESLCAGANPKRARCYALEGRLLALEVMGHLVDCYRRGDTPPSRPRRRPRNEVPAEAVHHSPHAQFRTGDGESKADL